MMRRREQIAVVPGAGMPTAEMRGGERHSPVDQITPANVDDLEVAWVYNHGDVITGGGYRGSGTRRQSRLDDVSKYSDPFRRHALYLFALQ